MKKYTYSPSGNPTLLIDNRFSEINVSKYPEISQKELSRKLVEQVGFIEKGKNELLRLQMMGGELCVNALRCLAFWNYEQTGQQKFLLESSGVDKPIECEIENWVSIKLPKNYKVQKIDENITFIEMEGIAYFVQTGKFEKSEASKQFNLLRKEYSERLSIFPALGLITVENENIYPLIYVRDTNSVIFETACGSGTIAAFIALKGKQKVFFQPSKKPFIVEEFKKCISLKGEVRRLEI